MDSVRKLYIAAMLLHIGLLIANLASSGYSAFLARELNKLKREKADLEKTVELWRLQAERAEAQLENAQLRAERALARFEQEQASHERLQLQLRSCQQPKE